MVAGVEQRLLRDHWFPSRLTPGEMIGQGVMIELRDGNIWVHDQGEIGVGRFSKIRSYPVRAVSEAVKIQSSPLVVRHSMA